MMKKVYPRTGDTQTVYLNAVVKDPSIKVGDYTIYNDFVSDPLLFERNNVLYHYPINHERLIIGKFCSIACSAKFLFNCANHTLKSLSTYTFPLFYEDWDLEKSDVATAWDNKGDIVIGNDVWIGYEAVIMAGRWSNHSRTYRCYERRTALYDSRRRSSPTDKEAFR
jgi:virginiamycin A acetyltransferase